MWFGVSLLDAASADPTPVRIAWWVCVVFEVGMFFGLGQWYFFRINAFAVYDVEVQIFASRWICYGRFR